MDVLGCDLQAIETGALSGLHIPRLTMTLTVERFAVSERYGVLRRRTVGSNHRHWPVQGQQQDLESFGSISPRRQRIRTQTHSGMVPESRTRTTQGIIQMADLNKKQTREQKQGNALQQRGRGGGQPMPRTPFGERKTWEPPTKEHHPRRPGQEQVRPRHQTTQTIGPGHRSGPNPFSSGHPTTRP